MSDVAIRRATPGDDAALAAIDRATRSWLASPAPRPPDGTAFFEGALRGEFCLDGRYVDDLLMARDLTSETSEGAA